MKMTKYDGRPLVQADPNAEAKAENRRDKNSLRHRCEQDGLLHRYNAIAVYMRRHNKTYEEAKATVPMSPSQIGATGAKASHWAKNVPEGKGDK